MERPLWRRLVGDVFRLFWRLPVSRSIPRRRPAALIALLLSLLLALTSCRGASTGSDATASESAGPAFPVTATGDDGDLTLDAQVKAVDSTSNYPDGVPTTDLSAFTPNAEAIAKYEPDLVVLSDDLNGIVKSLSALKVPTL